jgi:two-component system, OmpR family, phosphate regulon response regulator PhoB
MDPTVLLVEDEPDVVDLLRFHLRRGGFKVLTAATGNEGLEAVRQNLPDAVILDIMLPGMSGLEVCRALKADPALAAIPVLMLTAKGDVKDRVKGLETGADDYVAKPFSPKEVVLRVQGLIKRLRSASANSDLLELAGIALDKSTLSARLDGRRLELTTTEFKLLTAFLNNPARTLSRDTLLRDVWGYATGADTRTVDTHIRRLREKLGDHANRLETIRGEGYRLNPSPAE